MRRQRGSWAALLLLGVATTFACKAKNNGTMMLVEINSDIPAAQLDEIQVTVTPSRGKGTTANFPLGASVRLPVQLALVPEGEPALDVELAIKGLSTKRDVAAVVATASFQSGKAFTAGIFLSRDCQLPRANACPGEQQCVAGPACVPKTQVVAVRPLGTPAADAGPPKPDAVIERPPRDTSAVTGAWATVSPPAFTGNLNGVHPVSEREVWVVATGGALGFVYRFDGTAWAPVPVPAPSRPLQGVWAAGPEDVWVVGFGGTILHRVGGVFSAIPSGVTANLAAVFGTGPSDVWFVGADKTVLHWDGTRVVAAAEGVTTDLTCGATSGPGNLWIGGPGGGVYKRNGNTWQRQAEGTASGIIYGLWTSGPSDVWAVGDGGAVHFDGAGWTKSGVGIPLALGIWGAAENDVWVVGRGLAGRGLTAHFDGNTWTEVPAPMSGALQSVRGISASDIWAVGKEVIRYH